MIVTFAISNKRKLSQQRTDRFPIWRTRPANSLTTCATSQHKLAELPKWRTPSANKPAEVRHLRARSRRIISRAPKSDYATSGGYSLTSKRQQSNSSLRDVWLCYWRYGMDRRLAEHWHCECVKPPKDPTCVNFLLDEAKQGMPVIQYLQNNRTSQLILVGGAEEPPRHGTKLRGRHEVAQSQRLL